MTKTPLDDLLEKLCSGDARAAEQVFLAYEPYLRMVVRRQLSARLRAKFDSMDVVQSVWADLWHKFQASGYRFTSADQLRAFLLTATRNRFLDRLRQHQKAIDREQPLIEEVMGSQLASTQPRPSEVVQAKDVWQELLALCSPAHQELLQLKRAGKSLAEIADQTGLHPSSIRRILYDLAREYGVREMSNSETSDVTDLDQEP